MGKAVPYLVSVPDPYDDLSPYHNWGPTPVTAQAIVKALKLTRPGSVIIVDNVVRKGAVVDPHSGDANVLGVRRFNDLLSKTKNVSATTLQTVGSKGYDGLTLALVSG